MGETEKWWMDGVTVVADESDRPAWLEARRRYFTGSQVATLLDRHEYTKLPAVLAEKRTGKDDFDATQDHIRQGSLSEGFVQAYAEDCFPGLKLERCQLLLADPGCGKLAATPDCVTQDASVWGAPGPANVQLKWTKAGSELGSGEVGDCSAPGWAKNKGYKWGSLVTPNTAVCSISPRTLPSYIWHQVVLEAAVLGFATSFVVAYHRLAFPGWGKAGNQLRIYRVDAAAGAEALGRLRTAAERTTIEIC